MGSDLSVVWYWHSSIRSSPGRMWASWEGRLDAWNKLFCFESQSFWSLGLNHKSFTILYHISHKISVLVTIWLTWPNPKSHLAPSRPHLTKNAPIVEFILHRKHLVNDMLTTQSCTAQRLYNALMDTWIVDIGVVFKVIILSTVTCDSNCCTCLGHLGHCNRDRIISIDQGK